MNTIVLTFSPKFIEVRIVEVPCVLSDSGVISWCYKFDYIISGVQPKVSLKSAQNFRRSAVSTRKANEVLVNSLTYIQITYKSLKYSPRFLNLNRFRYKLEDSAGI